MDQIIEESSQEPQKIEEFHQEASLSSQLENQVENTHEEPVDEKDQHLDSSKTKDSRSGSHGQVSERYAEFLTKQQALPSAEDKLRAAVEFMSETLAVENGTPHFKTFWDARTLALDLFKECATIPDRSELWERYSALSKEARRLKVHFDEQGAFASEQIDIAISALEAELTKTNDPSEGAFKQEVGDFLAHSKTLFPKRQQYFSMQKALELLTTQASRITALRKELIRTEMRIKQKNKFFQRLSSAGDSVFPKRKDLIKSLSDLFSNDVATFVENNFTQPAALDALFFLREEIKAFQGAAKEITLNSETFSKTRLMLSESWDKLKVLDKERKKVRAEQKEVLKQNHDLLQGKINTLKESIGEGIGHENVLSACSALAEEMQRTSLERDEYKALRSELDNIRRPIVEQMQSEEQHRRHQADEREKLRKARIRELRFEIEAFMSDLDSYDVDMVAQRRDELTALITALTASKSEKQDLERLLLPVKDAIVDKREKALMALSADDRQAVQQLKELLQERLNQRKEIKEQLKVLRKGRDTSSLDFDLAMKLNAQEAAEKERLNKVSLTIQELESKLASLHG